MVQKSLNKMIRRAAMFTPQSKVTPTAPIYGGQDQYYEKLYPPAFPRRCSAGVGNNDAGSYSSVSVLQYRRSSRTSGGGGSRSPADSGRGTMSSTRTTQSGNKKITVEIVRTDMPNWLSAQIVEIYRVAAEKRPKIADIVNAVRKDLEKEFCGATWTIIAQRNDSEDVGYYHVISMPGYGIDLDCNGYAVRISLEKSSQIPRSLRPDQGQLEVKSMNDMDDKQLAAVKKLAYDALKTFDTCHERSEYIYEKLMKEPGRTTWMVKVGQNDEGAAAVTGKLKPGAYAAFSIGPVLFEVAKILSR